MKYLKDPHKAKVSKLVENLNIFLDKDKVLPVDGKIVKVARFELEVKKPTLLGIVHHLTNLIISTWGLEQP